MKVLYFLFLFLCDLCALARGKYLIYIEFIILSFFSDSSDFNYIKNTFLIQNRL